MKTRPKPTRTATAKAAALAARDNRIQKAIDARVAWLRGKQRPEDEPRPWEFEDKNAFTEPEVSAILILAQKEFEGGAFDLRSFVKKIDETTPVISKPRLTNKPLDLYRMLSQIEILGKLWPRWNARSGKRGADPGYLAKALLVCTAALGISAHLDDNYEKLTGEERDRDKMLPPSKVPTRLQVVFDWIEAEAARIAGVPRQPFKFKAYKNACEQIQRIVDEARNPGALLPDHCIVVNIEMLKWLAVTYPSTCVRLAIDGMLIPAWVQQVGKRDPETEKRIRGKHAPKASARFMPARRGGTNRFVRGYYVFALTDLATNLPVVWGLWPAGDSNFEARALKRMLNELFEVWGDDCPTKFIVADRAWDDKEAVRDCALRYGIHLIVGRDDERASKEERAEVAAGKAVRGGEVEVVAELPAEEASDEDIGVLPTETQAKTRKVKRTRFPLHVADHPHVESFDRHGNAYCRYCKSPKGEPVMLKRTSYEFMSPEKRVAAGMKPGEAMREGSAFRVFYECPNSGCAGPKKRSLPMHLHWTALSAYPHTIESGGRVDLHAERLALYARRNSCEALFGALKLGHKVGLSGSTRTHTPNERTIETLVSLAMVMRTALATAAERIEQGGPDIPQELLEALRDAR